MKRLARALASATEGNGGSEKIFAGFNNANLLSSLKNGAGDDTVEAVAGTEEGDRDVPVTTRVATTVTSGWYPQATPPPSQFAGPSAAPFSGGGGAEATPQRSSNENNARSFARGRQGGEGGQPRQPSLAWEATVDAAIRESTGASGQVRQRDMPRDAHFVPRTINPFDDLGVDLAVFSPSAAAVRCGSPRRRNGTSSARVVRRGSPRRSRSPDRGSTFSGETLQLDAPAVVNREDISQLYR